MLLQSTRGGRVLASGAGMGMADTAGEWQFDHAPGDGSAVEVYVRGAGGSERVKGAEGAEGATAMAPRHLTLRGPFCDRTRMLPATFRLQPLAPGVWHTKVMEPCYWTPLSPAYYRLETDQSFGGPAGPSTIVGLRRLEVRGAQLLLDGRRWVFRAARADRATLGQIDRWHESLLGLLVAEPDERLLEAASRRGVPVMIELDDATAAARLPRAARWPAVQFALLPAAAWRAAEELATRAPNLLPTTRLAPGDTSIPDGAQAVLCELDDRLAPQAVLAPGALRRPLLVAQPPALQWNVASDRDPADVRRACELLQQRLDAAWDISGYLV